MDLRFLTIGAFIFDFPHTSQYKFYCIILDQMDCLKLSVNQNVNNEVENGKSCTCALIIFEFKNVYQDKSNYADGIPC